MSAFLCSHVIFAKIAVALCYGLRIKSEKYDIDGNYDYFYLVNNIDNLEEYSDKDINFIYRKLYTLNLFSLSERYEDFDYVDSLNKIPDITDDLLKKAVNELPKFSHNMSYNDQKGLQFLKDIHCYLYQSCEGLAMDTPLYKGIDALKGRVADHLIINLPEYDETRWDR